MSEAAPASKGTIMRIRALGAAFAGLIFCAVAARGVELPRRPYVSDLYRSTVEREILVGHDARLLGMGSAGVGLTTSADGVAWNPASLASAESPSIGLMDSAPSATGRSRNSALSGATPVRSLGIDRLGGVGASAWFDGWGSDDGKQRSFLAGCGAAVGPLSAGVAWRHERRYFTTDTLSAWSADVGLMARGLVGHGGAWGAGVSATRLGQRLKDQRGILAPRGFSPATVTMGGWYALARGPLLVTEISYVGDGLREARDRVRWRVGAEQALIGGRLDIRLGYTSIANYDRISHGLATAGASVHVDGGSLAYAFVTGQDGIGGDFESRHFVSFRIAWAGHSETRYAPTAPLAFALPAAVTPPPVSVRNSAFSPNGDGVRDTFALDVGSGEPGARLEIVSRAGTTVATNPLGDRLTASWDGLDMGGVMAPDGLYRWNLVARGRVMRSGVVLLDATAPELALAPSTVALLPGDNPPHGLVRIGVAEDGIVEGWSIVVSTAGDVALERRGVGSPPTEAVAADIGDLRGGRVYEATLTVSDEAGNESVASATFSALDLREHGAWAEDDLISVDAPSTYFDAGGAELSRRGRELAETVAGDAAGYVTVQAAPGGLEGERAAAISAALVAAGLSPDHVALGAREDANVARSVVRLLISREPLDVARSPVATAGAPARYRVLVGSFRARDNAEKASAGLVGAGFTPRVVEAALASGLWYRVTVGSFDGRDDAEALSERLREHISGDPVILTPAVR